MARKRVIQIYLDEEEYDFLYAQAKTHRRSMAQTLLALADLPKAMRTTAEANNELPIKLKGINFSATPLEDYRSY